MKTTLRVDESYITCPDVKFNNVETPLPTCRLTDSAPKIARQPLQMIGVDCQTK